MPRNLLRLHFIVILYGFTAILGRLISLDATALVWYRILMAVAVLMVYARFKGLRFNIPPRAIGKIAMVGLVVVLHWITFYRAIKVSNVSVALGCFASTTLFASIVEPFILRRKVRMIEVIIGLIIIAGLYLIFRFETNYAEGIITSVISAFLAVLFTVLNKTFTHQYHPVEISIIEMSSGWLAVTLWLMWVTPSLGDFPLPQTADWLWLLILAVVCTAYSYVVSIDIMKTISPYTVVLTINLEPIYSIALAWLIFGETEHMTGGFYAGAVVILGAVFLYPVLRRKVG